MTSLGRGRPSGHERLLMTITIICSSSILLATFLICSAISELTEKADYVGTSVDDVYRRVTSNGDDNDDSKSQSSLSGTLSNSLLVQDNSDVFIQLGKFLSENTSPTTQSLLVTASQEDQNDMLRMRSSADAADVDDAHAVPAYHAWPLLQPLPSNTSISQSMQPPGYLKQAGRDFDLSEQTVRIIQLYLNNLAEKHTPANREDWEHLNAYPENEK